MKTLLRAITIAAFVIMSSAVFAQTDEHHPDTGASAVSKTTAAPEPKSANLPEQCMTMMSMMQKMMPMMQEMMQAKQSGMMQSGMMQDMPMGTAGMSDATKSYMEAMKKMDGPMMQGVQSSDPDVAFVQAMIPHHRGAIDMARAVLQFGKDEQVKAWANQIIAAQESEIAAMQEWLTQHTK